MKNKKTGFAVAVCCLGSLAATNGGRAALTQIAVTHNDGVSGLTSKAYSSSQGDISFSWAGNWNAKIVGGAVPSGAPAMGSTWQSFCMDVGNSMGDGTYSYTASAFSLGDPPAGNGPGGDPPDPKWVTGGGAKAGYLYANHLAAMVDAVDGSALERIARSALAISIWEVLYESDTTYSVRNATAGTAHNATKGFEVTGSGAASTGLGIGSEANQAIWLANSWLAAAMSLDFDGAPSSTWWKEDSSANAQSLIGTPTAVPEPSTYVAGALLVLPFFASTIRRKLKVS